MDSLDSDDLTTNRQKVAAIILWDRLAPQALNFSHQPKAQKLALELSSEKPPWNHSLFVCLALLHVEDAALVEKGMKSLLKMMKHEQDEKLLLRFRRIENTFVQHLRILQEFGRYPWQNEALGRSSTPAELKYRKTPVTRKHQETSNQLLSNAHNAKPLRILVLHGNREPTFANSRPKFATRLRKLAA